MSKTDKESTGSGADKKPVKKNLNQQIEELDAQVEWFYSDDFKLEEAPEKYRAAVKLARDIEEDSKKLQNEIEILTKDFSK